MINNEFKLMPSNATTQKNIKALMNSMKNRNSSGKGTIGNIMQVNMGSSLNYNFQTTQGTFGHQQNRVPSGHG